MDFFQQQDIARRNTRGLVLVFCLAVLALIVLTNAVVAGFLFFADDYNVYSGSRGGLQAFLSYFSWQRFGGIGIAVTAVVALVVLVRWIQLSTGGKVVAESMGGVRILPQTRDRAERRCLNVVEEMALAANMPVPPVYVMNHERGINAFAAGIVPADAVIAVTRGTIDHLKRHELQGVIAHEFSHILNGDMRLNIRLAAMLKGITFIGDVGHILLRSSNRVRTGGSSRGQGAALPILGLALWVLGWLGGLAAGFIKAGISRQKEYLADASAVQFTRDPRGIADALKVIGGYLPGSLVHAARAAEMSHIFFGEIEHHLWQLFATHPPLQERIRRLDKQWDGNYIQRKPKHYPNPKIDPSAVEGHGRAAIVAAAMASVAAADNLQARPQLEDADFPDDVPGQTAPDYEAETAEQEGIPVALVRHSHEPLGAHAVISALLMSPDEAIYQQQMTVLQGSATRGLAELTHTLYPAVAALGAPRRLPLMEMCLPALKSISFGQYRSLKQTLLRLIQADARIELHEWCLYQLVRHYLDPEFIQVKPSSPRYRRLARVRQPLQVTLSVLAHEGGGHTETVYQLGMAELDLADTPLLAREQCSVAAFSKAVHTLADVYPLLKPRVLKAMTLAAGEDGRLSPEEKEIIAAMAAVMDCPSPELL
ncbi:M48 family metallopeptidase [Pseudohalioglobus sediminis]|uniref:M48 family metallopeptidase n=1 Tax=Pseudohalioglobus sediminis TaxID=2606449 RepID=A0A5B0WQ34_9GAMM|nr:M48 family metallopeptidase [Pseudohalioglobus sediminis]KAA1188906.1 M48 family metallopeptidase [Pseudohalioglobus sediminis]